MKEEISTHLSYILGVLLGDGWISKQYFKKGKYIGKLKHSVIGLESIDFEFNKVFEETLKIEFNCYPKTFIRTRTIKIKNHIYPNHKTYFTYLYSNKIANSLNNLSNSNFWEKIDIPNFLGGLYDSESCINITRDKRYINSYKRRIGINMNESLDFFKKIQSLLHKLGIDSNITEIKKGFSLNIYKSKSINKFANIINFDIIRKIRKLDGMLRVTPLLLMEK